MLKRRKLATVFLTSLVIFAWSLPVNDVHSLSTTPVSSGLILDGGFDVVPDGAGNFYIFSYDKESSKTALSYFFSSDTQPLSQLKFYNSSDRKIEDTLSYKYSSINISGDVIYIAHVDGANSTIDQLQEKTISGQSVWVPKVLQLDSIVINAPQKIAVANNDNIFLLKSDKETTVCARNMDEEISNTKLSTNDESIAAITTDTPNNYLYAATNNTLYRYKISDSTYTFEKATVAGNFAPFKFLTDNIFITSAGKICALNSSEFKLDSNVDMQVTMSDYDKGVAIAGFDNASILAKTAEKVVSRIRCSDGAETGKIGFSEKVLAVATSGEKTIVVTGTTTATNIHLITASDITEITPPEPEKPPEIGGGTNPDNPNPDTPPETPDDTTIESTEGYEVGENVISKIPAGTTWGTLRNGLEANYITVELNGKGNATTSTKVATGHKITFIFDNERKVTKTFTLVVEGDVTGSGNISSKSISALANHLLGKSELDGVFLEAANLSGDGDLSTVDLLLMYKQTQK